MTQYVAAHNKFLERFAEMVIRECLDKIQEVEDSAENIADHVNGFYDGLEVAKTVIKQHFGMTDE